MNKGDRVFATVGAVSTAAGPDRAGVKSVEQDARGLVDPATALRHFTLDRAAPCAALAWAVVHHWSVRWDVEEPFDQRIVTHPAVHLTFEPEGAFVTGVATGDWVRHLVGRGCVLGVKFRPAGFRPFLTGPVRGLTNTVVPMVEIFGAAARPLVDHAARRIAADDPVGLIPAVEEFLAAVPVTRLEESVTVSGIVEHLTGDPTARRVAELADLLGTTPRQLQRLFAEWVGVSPKWVIDRARIHEIGERVRRDPEVRWAELAAELGYADQAHLTRQFTRAVGSSPARYASRQRP